MLLQLLLVKNQTAGEADRVAGTTQGNNSCIAICLACLEQRGEEQFCKKRMTHVVCPKLHFVAFFRCGVGARHYARVVDKDVETSFGMLKGCSRVGDGRERGEVER